MAPPQLRRAGLAVLAAVLLFLATAPSHGVAHAPLVADDPGAGSRAVDHGRYGATACAAEEGCAGDGGGEVATASSRRELGGGNHIGYDALRRNAVPCSHRGASYYNCRPGGQANPYSRGCSAITRCRG